jgi:hypothetical protein
MVRQKEGFPDSKDPARSASSGPVSDGSSAFAFIFALALAMLTMEEKEFKGLKDRRTQRFGDKEMGVLKKSERDKSSLTTVGSTTTSPIRSYLAVS